MMTEVAPALALGLYLAGLVAAFGVRSWIHRRRTGSSGFRGVSGAPGSPEWWGGILFAAALVLGAAGPVLALTGTVAAPRLPQALSWAGASRRASRIRVRVPSERAWPSRDRAEVWVWVTVVIPLRYRFLCTVEEWPNGTPRAHQRITRDVLRSSDRGGP